MRKRLPPLTALKSFEAAARLGSFKDAASELFVSHSAISHQVKQLEEYLNVELFERRARAVYLTKVGKAYYPMIRDAFDRISEATDVLLSPKAANIITVQLYSTFAIRWMIPRLPKFAAEFPNIQVRINTAQTDVDFSQDDVDVCVMIGNRTEQDLHYDYLFTSEMFPVASPSFLEQHAIDSPSDLSKQTILQVYPSPNDWSVWLDTFNVPGVHPETGLQFDSYDHALSTAVQGLGVALAMQPYVDRELASGMLVEVFDGLRARAAGDWYMVCRRDKSSEPKVSIFREWFMRELLADPAIKALASTDTV